MWLLNTLPFLVSSFSSSKSTVYWLETPEYGFQTLVSNYIFASYISDYIQRKQIISHSTVSMYRVEHEYEYLRVQMLRKHIHYNNRRKE